MTQKLTILFDLDGTLVDTAPDLMGAHNHVMKKFGYPQKSLDDIKHIAGRGAWIMMQRTFRDEIKDEKLKKEMVKEFINYYAKNIDRGSKPIKGVVKFLDWAKSKKILMAVCTNKQERLAVDLLKKINLSQYFEYIAGCDTFDFNKPDPRHLTNVIDIIGGDIKKSIMFCSYVIAFVPILFLSILMYEGIKNESSFAKLIFLTLLVMIFIKYGIRLIRIVYHQNNNNEVKD